MSADHLREPTLREMLDEGVIDLLRSVIGAHHPNLSDARFLIFWTVNQPVKKWGAVKIATEEFWRATGAMDRGVDILVKLNQSLWAKLTVAGRTFLLDHYLSLVKPKGGGKTHMAVETGGERQLYEKDFPSLSVHPAVLARNAQGLREIDELERMWKAMNEPAQFLLDLEAGADDDENDEDEEDGEATASSAPPKLPAPRSTAMPVSYYERRSLEIGGSLVFAVLRFSGADKRSSDLTGVHVVTPDETDRGPFAGVVHNNGLTYDDRGATIKKYRAALEAEGADMPNAATADAGAQVH